MPPPKTSARFRRAAAGEHERATRELTKVNARRSELERALSELDAQRRELEERLRALDALGADPTIEAVSDPTTPASDARPISGRSLRGAEIRDAAVRVLIESGRTGPLHYREWLKLVEAAGFIVEGKRPEAVFLNQLTRSPLVKASTRAGIYELDYQAPDRLKGELERLREELTTTARSSTDPAVLRDQTREITRRQRSLEEAQHALRPLSHQAVAA